LALPIAAVAGLIAVVGCGSRGSQNDLVNG
jgi:hypothetical protein